MSVPWILCLVRACSPFVCCLSPTSPYSGREGESSGVSLIRALTPFMNPHPHDLCPQMPSHWGLGFNMRIWEGHKYPVYNTIKLNFPFQTLCFLSSNILSFSVCSMFSVSFCLFIYFCHCEEYQRGTTWRKASGSWFQFKLC
jgi:hypothetical protein